MHLYACTETETERQMEREFMLVFLGWSRKEIKFEEGQRTSAKNKKTEKKHIGLTDSVEVMNETKHSDRHNKQSLLGEDLR